ncbi:MAG: AMP-binding protein [Gammaproteobacteria bacterium]|nr:AMP-binding protein [Gammaproteobacteria bacterium]
MTWGHRGQALIPLDRPATIVFTSGSTGVPRAVLHTCGNHYYNALGSNTNLPLTTGDRWLLNLPLHHVAGLGILFRCLLTGAAVVLPGKQRHARPEMLALEDDRRDAESAASEPIGDAAISRCGISNRGDAGSRRAR